MSEIIAVVLVLLVVGVVLYLVNTFVPMEPRIKQLLNIVVVVALALWLIVRFLVPLLKSV